MAAITQATLASAYDGVNRTVYTTASQTPTGNLLLLACVTGRTVADSDSGAPTLSGNGVTWVQIGSLLSTNRQRITLFRGMVASPSAGAVTITFSEDQFDASWIFTEFTEILTTGANGADAVRSITTNQLASAEAITVTLPAFEQSINATFGFFAKGGAQAWVPGTGFAEIDDHGVSGALGAMCEWRNDNHTGVDASSAGAGTMDAIALEIVNSIRPVGTSAAGTAGHLGFNF